MKVLGPIVNGDNMMIGANAVMIKDAPFGSVQGGAYEISSRGYWAMHPDGTVS